MKDGSPRRDLLVLIVGGLLLLIALPLLWGMAMMAMMGPWMMGGWLGYSSPWWGVAAIVFGVLIVLGLILLVVGLGGLAALQAGPLGQPKWTGTPVADGELIFHRDGPPMRMSCAACHGVRGQGGRIHVMMRTVDAPAITWTELTSAHHESGEAHPLYTEATLRRAITQGVDAGGEPLDPLMPRWQLTDEEWEALLAYLKTLQ